MVSFKFKKGDRVIVNVKGAPVEFEIISPLFAGNQRVAESDLCYDARETLSGRNETVYEDEILRLATPIDNSARLFEKEQNRS